MLSGFFVGCGFDKNDPGSMSSTILTSPTTSTPERSTSSVSVYFPPSSDRESVESASTGGSDEPPRVVELPSRADICANEVEVEGQPVPGSEEVFQLLDVSGDVVIGQSIDADQMFELDGRPIGQPIPFATTPSPDRSYVAYEDRARGRTFLTTWAGELLGEVEGANGTFSPDSRYFVVTSVSRPEFRIQGTVIFDNQTRSTVATIDDLFVSPGRSEVQFSDDSRHVVGTSGGRDSGDQAVVLVDLSSGSEIWRRPGFHSDGFSPTGRFVVAVGDSSVELLDPLTGRGLLPPFATESEFPRVRLSPDDKWLVVESASNTLGLIDTASLYLIETGEIKASASRFGPFFPDSRRVFAAKGIAEGLNELWVFDLESLRFTKRLPSQFTFFGEFDPTGRFYFDDTDGHLLIWRVDGGYYLTDSLRRKFRDGDPGVEEEFIVADYSYPDHIISLSTSSSIHFCRLRNLE